MKYVEWLPYKVQVCRLGFFRPVGERTVHRCLDYNEKVKEIIVLFSYLMLRVIK